MLFEANACGSLQLQQSTKANDFLINTSKVLKGSKLKTKDFVRTQLMKFKHTTPNQCYQVQENRSLPAKAVQYTKFMPFNTIEQDEIHHIITQQRQQMSRETKERIKLFKNPKINATLTEHNFHLPANTFQARKKPATSHQTRQFKQKYLNLTSLSSNSYNNTISLEKQHKNAQLIFRTQNLDGKMNDFLNHLLHQDKPSNPHHPQQRKSPQVIQKYQTIAHANNLPQRKNNVTFVRQMKKNRRLKMGESSVQPLSQFDSEQFTQQISAEMSHRERTAKLQHRANRNAYNYSVQIKKRGKTVDFGASLLKRQQEQNDSVFQSKIS